MSSMGTGEGETGQLPAACCVEQGAERIVAAVVNIQGGRVGQVIRSGQWGGEVRRPARWAASSASLIG